MKYKIVCIIALVIISCTSKPESSVKTVELTFQSVAMDFFYGATEAQFEEIIKEVDSSLANDPNQESHTLARHLKKLEEMKLLRKPYILAYDANDTQIKIYLDAQEYQKVENFTYRDLYNEGKKVMLQLELIKKDTLLYYSNHIKQITKIKGDSRINGKTMHFFK